MNLRQTLAPVATFVMAMLLGASVFTSAKDAAADRRAHQPITVNGIISPEQIGFFSDPRVQAELQKRGFDVHVTAQEAREQALTADPNSDFYLVAGEPEGRAVADRLNISNVSTPFYTTLVLASWKNAAQGLQAAGLTHQQNDVWVLTDLGSLVQSVAQSPTWSTFTHKAYANPQPVLIAAANVRRSGSADMLLALSAESLAPTPPLSTSDKHALVGLFRHQPSSDADTASVFDDYKAIGGAQTPLAAVYEQQVLEYARTHPGSGMLILYPKPGMLVDEEFVALTTGAQRLGQLLASDPTLLHLEQQHGFRNSTPLPSNEWKGLINEQIPANIDNLVRPPSFAHLEDLVRGVESGLEQ